MHLNLLTQFLRKILPDEGWLCCWVIPNGCETKEDISRRSWHEWVRTPEELAEKILGLDTDPAVHTVYHACASFIGHGGKHGRTSSRARYARALWLDIDAGQNKEYKTFQEAYEAVQAFCTKAELPNPLYVGSGYALHVYWPFTENVSPELWKEYALGLKTLCKGMGLHADPSRTSDIASILRPIGTHNRKNPLDPRIVSWAGDIEAYDPNIFSFLRTKKPSWKNTREGMEPNANPYQIASQCAQMRRFRDTQGLMPEPDWKACLGVLAFCDKGDAVAHEWSQGDARYSPQETTQKLEASRVLTGPITCAHFELLNDLCKGCLFKGRITTPVQLGRGAPIPEEIVKISVDAPELPDVGAFSHVGGALFFRRESKDGKIIHDRITQYPIIVESILKSELNSDSYSLVLMHKPPHDMWQKTVIPLKVLFSSSGIAEVMGRGIVVHNADLFKMYIRESMDMLNATQRAQMQYEQFGWKEDDTAFLIGDRLYTSEGVRIGVGNKTVQQRMKGLGPQLGASLDVWKEHINKLFAKGFEAQGFAVIAAFSAPFMRWQSRTEGGAIISLVSRASGKGKTVALTAAASVWGRLDTMKQISTDTRVSRGIGMGVMGNLPVFRDEFNLRDPEILRDEIQIFTEGRDKQRGSKEGGLVDMGAAWQTLMIAGSNSSLTDTLRSARNGEPMSRRVIEAIVDIPKTAEHWKGDQLQTIIDDNAGVAGDIFIRHILQPANMAFLRDLLPKTREELIIKHGLTSEKRFVARTLAGIAVAAIVVKEVGLLDFSVDRIIEWAESKFLSTDDAAYEYMDTPVFMLARFLSENLPHTLVMPEAGRTRMPAIKMPMHKLIVRQELKPPRIYIETKAIRSWLQREEQPWKDFIDDLYDKDVLINRHRLITLSAGTELATGQVPCIELKADHPLLTGMLVEVEKQERTA